MKPVDRIATIVCGLLLAALFVLDAYLLVLKWRGAEHQLRVSQQQTADADLRLADCMRGLLVIVWEDGEATRCRAAEEIGPVFSKEEAPRARS